MPTKLIPLGSVVVVHPIDAPEKRGSIYVPQIAKRRTNQGIVVARGSDVSDDLDIGDHICFNSYTGDKVSVEDSGVYYLIPEHLVIAKIENSGVKLIDTDTVKRLIVERIGEMRLVHKLEYNIVLNALESDLLDRINMFTQAEGFEF